MQKEENNVNLDDEVKERTEHNNTDDNNTKEGGTVPVTELQRRLHKQSEKHAKELLDLEERLKTEYAEELKKAQMSDNERRTYEQAEKERAFKQLSNDYDNLKKELEKRDLRENAINTLKEKGIDYNNEVLNFVVKDNADDTLKAIDSFANIMSKQKQELSQTTPPRISGGGSSEKPQSLGQFAKQNRIIK